MIRLKFECRSIFRQKPALYVIAMILFSASQLSGQIRPISVLQIKDSLEQNSRQGHPIVLENDSNGLFYFNYFSKDTLMLRRQSGTSFQNYFIVSKDFNANDGLQHCIVKDKNRIILLNQSNNSIQCYECKGNGSLVRCTKLSEFKLELVKKERLIRMERDNQNIYLVSYNFNSHSQKFYLLNAENKATKLLYSSFNPFVEIFFSDDNVSNYSFYNNKLALTDFYSGNTLMINLLNSHVDTVKMPVVLNAKRTSLGTFEKLNNKYNKHATWANYDSLMNLGYNYNHTINSFFLNDSLLLITVRFMDLNSAPFEMIAININTQRAIFKQRRTQKKYGSEIVNLLNMPIYLGFEESNYIGDGIIYVYKEMPKLNKYDFGGFFNKMNELGGSKIGTFVMYKNVFNN